MYWRSVSCYRFCWWHFYASFSVKYTVWTQNGGIATIGVFSFQNGSTGVDKSWCSVSACRTGSKIFTSLGEAKAFHQCGSTLSRHVEVRICFTALIKVSKNEMWGTKRTQSRQWGRSQFKNWVLLSLKSISNDWAIVTFSLTWLCDCCPIGGAKRIPSQLLHN